MRLLILVLCLWLPVSALAEPLMILPVKLLDTSHEAEDQAGDHARRLDLLSDVLSEELSGVTLSREEVAAACPRETTDCLLGLLKERGADRGLFIVVQKASTLILQIFASVVDVDEGRMVVHKELNFRGDNDEAWRRAGRFLARQLRPAG